MATTLDLNDPSRRLPANSLFNTNYNDPARSLPLNGQFLNIGGTAHPEGGNQVPSLPTVSNGGAAPVATVAGGSIQPR